MRKLGTALSIAALTALAAPAVSAATLIDDFITNQRVQDAPSGSFPTSSVEMAPEAIGLFRSMSVSTSPADPFEGATQFTSGGASERLTFSNADGHTGTGIVTYDANGAGLGGVDLTFGNADRFFFEVTSFDILGAAIFSSTVCSTGMVCDTYDEVLDASFDPELLFSEFAGVDFTQITSLSFQIESTSDSFDGSIGSISAVPLPASALLLLGGLGGLGGISAARRRRRKS